MLSTHLAQWLQEFRLRTAGKWLVLGSLVGLVAGLGAILFHAGLQLLSSLVLNGLAGLPVESPAGEPPLVQVSGGTYRPWLILALPALGGLISGLLTYWLAPEAAGHGTDAAIDAYHRKHGVIRTRVPLVKMITSIATIATGGSGGREGPIAQIGAGFGSFLATRLGLSARNRRILLAAGVGAGVGAIFRAPLAGALFAAEVLYSSEDLEAEVLLPATVASIIAYSIYATKFGWGHMFAGAGAHGFTNPLELFPYLVLAVTVTLAAFVYVKVFYGVHGVFGRLPIHPVLRPVLGGVLTGGLAFVLVTFGGDPKRLVDVLSSGYGIIQAILDTDGAGIAIGTLLLVAIGKILTTSFSIGSGGSGGVFGPAMVIGASLGAAVGGAFHLIAPGLVAHPSTFAIVGMAGFFAAAANTPISTVIMVSELTGNYTLLVPTMWVCTFAFLLGKRWSIFSNQVGSRLSSPAHFGGQAREVFTETTVAEVFKRTRRFVVLDPDMNVREALDATSLTAQRLFPVVDSGGELRGCFRIDALTTALHHPAKALEEIFARDIMDPVRFFVRESDSVEQAQQLLLLEHAEELLVLEGDEVLRVVGIVTSADLLLGYTRHLSQLQRASEDLPEAPPPGDKSKKT